MLIRRKEEYQPSEWTNKTNPHCRTCVAGLAREGLTHRCRRCNTWQPRTAIQGQPHRSACNSCRQSEGTQHRKCANCMTQKPLAEFPVSRRLKHRPGKWCLECTEGRNCSNCHLRGGQRHQFTIDEWHNSNEHRKCKQCMLKTCFQCRRSLPQSQYSKKQQRGNNDEALCKNCDRKRCSLCSKMKTASEYNPAIWNLPDDSPQLLCKHCSTAKPRRGWWTCTNPRCKTPHREKILHSGPSHERPSQEENMRRMPHPTHTRRANAHR